MSVHLRPSAWSGVVAGSAVAAVLAASPALAVTAVGDSTQLVRVTSDAATPQDGWMAQSYDATANDQHWTIPDQSYVLGPTNNPAIGAGSHVLHVGQYAGQVEEYRTAMFDGTKASDITHLSYATYAAATNGDQNLKQPAYVRLSFNTSGDKNAAPDAFLFYEPSINHTDQNAIQDGVWQNWDTTNEEWSTTGGPDSLTTLQAFGAANPNAVIAGTADGADGGVAMIADGTSGQFNGVYGVDRFAITTASQSELFDFDPTVDTNTNTVTVTDGQGGWNAAAYNAVDDQANPVPQQEMAFGPETPPLGIGSHVIHYGSNTNVIELWRSPELDGVNVGDIRKLDYSTYVKPGADAPAGTQQPEYMRLSVSTNGDGVHDADLFFEPDFEHSGQVADNTWQTWNTADALWSTSGGPDALTTLAAFAAQYPKATVFTPTNAAGNGGLSIIAGCQCDTQKNTDFYVDDVEARYFHGAGPATDDTFDFEPTVPTPTINAPAVVLGRQTVDITGTTVPNAPVALFEKKFGATDFAQIDSTTAGDDGSYSFSRTVNREDQFYVRSYDRTNSDVAVVKVRIDPNLSVTTTSGKVHMNVHTSPRVVGETVKFFRRLSDGSRKLLASRTTNKWGNAHATVAWPSGHRITVFATVTAAPGTLRGHSPDVSIRVA